MDLEKQPETDGVIPVSEGDSVIFEDECINLETNGLRRSPTANKGGPLPKQCFFFKGINQELTQTTKSMNHLQPLNTCFDETINLTHNYVMTTQNNSDNDVYTYKNLLKQDDMIEFIKAILSNLMTIMIEGIGL